MLSDPRINACVFRKVGNTLKTSVYNQYIWAINALGLGELFEIGRQPPKITLKATGQQILFLGLDDPMKVKSIKTASGYIACTHFEELDQFAGQKEIRMVLQSTKRGGQNFWNFMSFNPPISRNNWANQFVLEERADTLKVKTTYEDVPIEWLGQAFLDDAEHLKNINERAYLHEYMGEAVGTGGSVFENVEVREITDEEIKNFDRIYMGLDWGWYPDPFHWVKMYYNAGKAELYIFDEYRTRKTSNRDTFDYLVREKDIPFDVPIMADIAEQKSIGDYKSYGANIRGAEKPAGSVDYSMKWLQSLRKIVICNKKCPDTANEFLEYEYERTKDGEIISGYPDKDNHGIDAVRYGMNRVWRRRGL